MRLKRITSSLFSVPDIYLIYTSRKLESPPKWSSLFSSRSMLLSPREWFSEDLLWIDADDLTLISPSYSVWNESAMLCFTICPWIMWWAFSKTILYSINSMSTSCMTLILSFCDATNSYLLFISFSASSNNIVSDYNYCYRQSSYLFLISRNNEQWVFKVVIYLGCDQLNLIPFAFIL